MNLSSQALRLTLQVCSSLERVICPLRWVGHGVSWNLTPTHPLLSLLGSFELRSSVVSVLPSVIAGTPSFKMDLLLLWFLGQGVNAGFIQVIPRVCSVLQYLRVRAHFYTQLLCVPILNHNLPIPNTNFCPFIAGLHHARSWWQPLWKPKWAKYGVQQRRQPSSSREKLTRMKIDSNWSRADYLHAGPWTCARVRSRTLSGLKSWACLRK